MNLSKDCVAVFLFDYGFLVSIMVIGALLLFYTQETTQQLQQINSRELMEAYKTQNIEAILEQLPYIEPVINNLWNKTIINITIALAFFLVSVTVFKANSWNILKKKQVNWQTILTGAKLNTEWFGLFAIVVLLLSIIGQTQLVAIAALLGLLCYTYFTPILYALEGNKRVKQAVVLGITQPRLFFYRLLFAPILAITIIVYSILRTFLPVVISILLAGAVYAIWQTISKYKYYKLVNKCEERK